MRGGNRGGHWCELKLVLGLVPHWVLLSPRHCAWIRETVPNWNRWHVPRTRFIVGVHSNNERPVAVAFTHALPFTHQAHQVSYYRLPIPLAVASALASSLTYAVPDAIKLPLQSAFKGAFEDTKPCSLEIAVESSVPSSLTDSFARSLANTLAHALSFAVTNAIQVAV